MITITTSVINKMQSEMADFAPGADSWPTGRNMRIVFDSGPFAPLCEKMTWFLRYASTRQTDRQTDMLITILHTPPDAK